MVDDRFRPAGSDRVDGFPSGELHAEQLKCAAHLVDPVIQCTFRVEQLQGVLARGVALKMSWCGGVDDGVSPSLCRSLEALLQRDRSFAQNFLKDRRALQRIAKLVAQETDSQQLQHCSRLERSAGLHCIVLAFRLARIDEFAAEVFLPILIAGSLSGVVQYLPGSRHQVQERQQDLAEVQPPSAYSNADETFGQPKKICNNSAFWPSTPLSSAQELAAHAIVNPLVNGMPMAIFDGCSEQFVCFRFM